MAASTATTPAEYLAELPADRREALEAVREVILASLPNGYVETMGFGMIAYVVPLSTYPDTYNKQPLMYAALASQKNHMAVYLSAIYSSDDARRRFEEEYLETGKRYDCGKSCVRFKKLDDLPLGVIGRAIASIGVDDFVDIAEAAHSRGKKKTGSTST
ncbi:MAG: DUF1801 domain-containing protein [Acidimicrobiia bacterium]|nr:DUF1801 domain-containing protein [Acidimicrobiia bacterium]